MTFKTRAINYDLFNRIIDWLDLGAPESTPYVPYPVQFNMNKGIGYMRGNNCGTTMCIAGAACQFTSPIPADDVIECQYPVFFSYRKEQYSVSSHAKSLLGGDPDQLDYLFFFHEELVHGDNATPTLAAELIRRYIKDPGININDTARTIEVELYHV